MCLPEGYDHAKFPGCETRLGLPTSSKKCGYLNQAQANILLQIFSDAFRQQQLEAERRLANSGSATSPGPGIDAAEQTEWTVGRKRKKNPKDVLGGVKLRKHSSTEDKKPVIAEKRAQTPDSLRKLEGSPREQDPAGAVVPPKPDAEQDRAPSKAATASAPSTGGLGLGAYSSDEDD